jgi:hypothetical protein
MTTKIIDKNKIITYGKPFESIRLKDDLADGAEIQINKVGMASMSQALKGSEILNSVLNCIDIKNPLFWTKLFTIAEYVLEQPLGRYQYVNIRLSADNHEKYLLIERKIEARFPEKFGNKKQLDTPELIFNSLLVLFNNEASNGNSDD